ncbi:hypothetical protein Tco_0674041 [Tanacetum coccineum]
MITLATTSPLPFFRRRSGKFPATSGQLRPQTKPPPSSPPASLWQPLPSPPLYILTTDATPPHHLNHLHTTTAATTVAPPTDTTADHHQPTSTTTIRGTPAMGTYSFHYCLGVLGGDTYDGYIFFSLLPGCSWRGHLRWARVKVDYHLAQRLQAQEQEELTDEEKARLFVQFLEQRRKYFAAKRVEEKRNRPPTRAQQRKLFDKAMKRVNTFVDMDAELVEGSKVRAKGSETRVKGSSKRAGEELEQESSKKQKLEDYKETTELQRLIEVIPDKEEVAIDVIPLETKPPSIVDWKIHKEGKKSYYQIIRADGSSKMYLVFSHMLKSFDKEDLETLWKLVKAKHGSTRLEEGCGRVL